MYIYAYHIHVIPIYIYIYPFYVLTLKPLQMETFILETFFFVGRSFFSPFTKISARGSSRPTDPKTSIHQPSHDFCFHFFASQNAKKGQVDFLFGQKSSPCPFARCHWACGFFSKNPPKKRGGNGNHLLALANWVIRN